MSFQGSSHFFSDSSGRLSSNTGYYGSKVLTLAGTQSSLCEWLNYFIVQIKHPH